MSDLREISLGGYSPGHTLDRIRFSYDVTKGKTNNVLFLPVMHNARSVCSR